MTLRQSLMVTDSTSRLGYASVTFVDPGVQIDETKLMLLPQLLPVKVSGSSYLSKTMAERTQSTLVFKFRISQGSVATRLRCDGNANSGFTENCPQCMAVKII